MKKTHMFLFAFVLLFMVLTLAACSLNFGSGTTVPSVESSASTTTIAPVTTTAPPVTTTAAVARTEKNPIVSAKIDESGNFVLKFRKSLTSKLYVTQKYSPVTAGNGYNGAHYLSCEFDETDRVVTLTVLDNLARNQAAIQLNAPLPEALTVYLRENDGNLEYAKERNGSYTVLASHLKDKTAAGVPLMSAMLRELDYGKQENHSEQEGMVLVVRKPEEGKESRRMQLRFRAREWPGAGQDLYTAATLGGSSNGFFNIDGLYEIPSATEKDSFSDGNPFKYCGDDITPININGTYIGANHGYNLIQCLPQDASYGLTEADIGRVFRPEGIEGRQYVLVRVNAYTKELRSNMLWFCPYDDAAMKDGNFGKFCNKNFKIEKGTKLISDDGEITVTTLSETCPGYGAGLVQFYTALNHVKQHAFLDGKYEIDLFKVATYEAEFIDFYEEYDVLYLPAVLRHLMDNVGKNKEMSHCSDELTESYVTFRISYRFHKNGATVLYSDYDFHKDVSLSLIGGVQSGSFSEKDHYIYLPGSAGDYKAPKLQTEGQSIDFNRMENGKPQSSCFQMTDANGAKAMNLGFNTVYGDGTPGKRDPYLKNGCGFYYTSYKMYPYFISGGKLKAGDHFSFIGYRLPSVPYDEDFIAVNWYWVGDEIFLSLHTVKAVDKTVSLPDYMNSMTAEIVEGSGMTVGASVTGNGLAATSAGAGYAIIRLTPAK